MSTTTEYIIKNDGAIVRRYIEEAELQMPNSLAESLCDKVELRMHNVFLLDKRPVGVSLTKEGYIYFTVPLTTLFLRAPFKLVNGVLVPVFTSKEDPIMTLEWPVLPNMRLYMMLEGYLDGRYQCISQAWLVAMDNTNKHYRLPLANIYDDCKVCLGDGNTGTDEGSFLAAIERTIDTFTKSQYNSDLWKYPDMTQQLFRFRPERDKFIPVPPDNAWYYYCTKVAVAALSRLAL